MIPVGIYDTIGLLQREQDVKGVHSMNGAASIGFQSLLSIFVSLFCIVLAWRLLLNVRIEAILRVKQAYHVKWMMIFLSVILGHLLARFILDYLTWSRWLPSLISS
ncbi:Uncharacterized membrane protein YwzB [Thermoactinomyces sp. DSM 45891]|nr:Uncharacterized membrane protein YwzB [Thermoactinomyces sp. DSM 45891]